MTPTLARASARHFLRHPWQTGLAVLGVALGVAVVLSIDLANESARRAFVLAGERVAGRATHHVVGGPTGLPDDLYRHVRVDLGVRPSAPLVERTVALPDVPGRTLVLLGVDPLAEAPFRELTVDAGPVPGRDGRPGVAASVAPRAADRNAGPAPRTDGDDRPRGPPAVPSRGDLLRELMVRPGTVALAADTAAELGLTPGDRLDVALGARRLTVEVVGVLTARERWLEGLMVADIATAQELARAPGRIDRIDLRVPEGADGDATLARVRAVLPPGAEIVPAAARGRAIAEMTRAFQVNLTALSLLALFVGFFLVYNTVTFAVVQRRPLLGSLRALGVTRREVLSVVLSEAVVLGLVAVAVGVPLGVLLAQGMLTLVTRTINDLYAAVAVRELAWSPLLVGKAVALGVGGTVLAALVPALEATAATARTAMSRAAIERRAARAVPRLAGAGLGLIATGSAILALAGPGLGPSYAGLFTMFLGAACLTPLATVGLVRALEPLLAHVLGPAGRLAARGVSGALSRTGVAVAALMIAIAASVGVSLMIGSFRQTVARWLEVSLQADIYVSAPSLVGSRPDATLPPDVVDRLRQVPGVVAVGSSRVVRVESPAGATQVVALDIPLRARYAWSLAAGRADEAWHAFDGGDIFVSEPLAWHRGLRVGDRLPLRTDRGEVAFRVAGIVHDYGSSEGLVLLSRRTYDALWQDRAVTALGVHVVPGTEEGPLIAALHRVAGDDADLRIRSNRRLREESLAIFDRTFAVTAVLRVLVTIVAFIGVLAALMALGLERARELAVLRAQGLTPAEVWRLLTAQSGLMGLAAGLVALPAGITLAAVLVFVINRRSFGWSMDLAVSPETLLQALGLALGAALLAAVYPAWRLARGGVAAALRDE